MVFCIFIVESPQSDFNPKSSNHLKIKKMKTNLLRLVSLCLIFIVSSLYYGARAQVDTTQSTQPGVTKQEKGKEEKKKEKKRKDEFIIYGGVNFNQLSVSESQYESTMKTGYHIGFDYKRGKFFYWQVGLRYNNAIFSLKELSEVSTVTEPEDIAIRGLDIPVTGGINFLSALNRIVALRIFVSAVPSFNLGVGDNNLGFTKDSLNSFVMYGQGGIGINVAFIVLEAGYNYGFQDIFKNDVQSKPGQVFVNLGFRF